MVPVEHLVNSYCEDDWGAHERCPHRWGFGGGNLWTSDRFVRYVTLCPCPCHASCPLAGKDRLPEAEWQAQCECPAAAEEKIESAARHEQFVTDKENKRVAFQEALEASEGVDDGELEELVRAAYQRHGLEADDRQIGLLADVIRTKRKSPVVQPLEVVRIVGKAFAPAIRAIGDAIRDERQRRRETPEE
jgi:hypothetical protein